LIVEQIKSQLEDSQTEAKELREKVSDLQRQITEERFDKQLIFKENHKLMVNQAFVFQIVDAAHCYKSW
jgi:hypothetical protein